ncbi:MAG: GNAT family N-acetyltransferase [Paracoccaceae bacterium]
MDIRQMRPADMDAVHQICLATGNSGGDATALYDDPKLIGQIYAAPYAKLCSKLCFVAVDAEGVVGFVVGTVNTEAFFDTLETHWWPGMRKIYPVPDPADRANWTVDQKRHQMMHFPEQTPGAVTGNYPAHMHLNLLARARGMGLGRQLLDRLLLAVAGKGAQRAHVGCNANNVGGLAFWQACGFQNLSAELSLPVNRTIWLGRQI